MKNLSSCTYLFYLTFCSILIVLSSCKKIEPLETNNEIQIDEELTICLDQKQQNSFFGCIWVPDSSIYDSINHSRLEYYSRFSLANLNSDVLFGYVFNQDGTGVIHTGWPQGHCVATQNKFTWDCNKVNDKIEIKLYQYFEKDVILFTANQLIIHSYL